MRKIVFTIPLIFLIINVFAKKGKEKKLGGIWSDSTSASFTNCSAQFTILGDSVYMTHFLEFNGQPFYEIGKGVIKGDSLIYEVFVKHKIEGWATSGKHALKISKDGNTLEGIIYAGNGYVGPIVFRRRKF